MINSINLAAQQLKGIAHQTPVLSSTYINELTGAEVFFKCENFQRSGSFKFRGAYNALSQLSDVAKKQGVLAFSSGNHAQGIALSGKLLQIPTTIIMPHDAPTVKIEATQNYGAEVILYHRGEESREKLAAQIVAETGKTLIPPFNHPHIIAGQATVALELLQETRDLDMLFVCTGGAGLLSGCAVIAKHLQPNCKVYGVEPQAGNDAQISFRSKKLHQIEVPNSIADGALTQALGDLTFPLVLQYVDDIFTVTDHELAKTMFLLWERMKIMVEPTGALAASGMFNCGLALKGKRIGIVISGGNIDLNRIPAYLALASTEFTKENPI